MFEVRQTDDFSTWFRSLADADAKRRIGQRIARVQAGLFGDLKSVGDKVSELRIDYGPGYRVYFTRHGKTVVILLCGGDKRTQSKDIKKAEKLAAQLE